MVKIRAQTAIAPKLCQDASISKTQASSKQITNSHESYFGAQVCVFFRDEIRDREVHQKAVEGLAGMQTSQEIITVLLHHDVHQKAGSSSPVPETERHHFGRYNVGQRCPAEREPATENRKQCDDSLLHRSSHLWMLALLKAMHVYSRTVAAVPIPAIANKAAICIPAPAIRKGLNICLAMHSHVWLFSQRTFCQFCLPEIKSP